MTQKFPVYSITCRGPPRASWSKTVFILSELTNNKEVSESTHFLDKSYHLSFDATRNPASLSTKKIYIELSSTKICQLLLPHKKAISLPIEGKQHFPKNKKGLDCLEFLYCKQQQQQQLESDFLLTYTHTG